MTVLLSAGPLAGVGEGVVEGVERTARRDRHLEASSDACVLDRDRHRVHVRVPEQEDADTVALAGGELAGGGGGARLAGRTGEEPLVLDPCGGGPRAAALRAAALSLRRARGLLV